MIRPFPRQAGGESRSRSLLGRLFFDRQVGKCVSGAVCVVPHGLLEDSEHREMAFSASGRWKIRFGNGRPLSCAACKGAAEDDPFSRPRDSKRADCHRRSSAKARSRTDSASIPSSSRWEIPSKYAKRRVLRCFGAVFQKGNLSKSRFRSMLSRAPRRKGGL